MTVTLSLQESPRLARHKKCRDGLLCKGPGCTVITGKTQAKRKGKRNTR